jgi:hypothetical protein
MATLLADGDSFEKHYWTEFLSTEFPSYEKYWASQIVPMTNRPINIHFKKSEELTSQGYSSDDICKAQLHYTTFRHLARAFELRKLLATIEQTTTDVNFVSEGLFHLTGAQDVAFEFLQRVKAPNHYDPWAPTRKVSLQNQPASKEAMEEWKRNNDYPLQEIRNYRNHLTHGRLCPSIQISPKILIPKIGFESQYLDWRFITDWDTSVATNAIADFDFLENILTDAWHKTINYLESEWQKIT